MSAAGPCSRKVGQWEVGAQLGSGSFAVVWHAVHCETGVHAAIKEIPTARLTPKLKESLDSEIKVLGCVRHRNIVSLLDTIVEPDRIFLVLEYCPGGDLSDLIRRHGRLSEAQARRFMHQLGAGLKALRTHNLIHRDLKPQNLLLTTQGDDAEIKIADFGFARDLQPAGMADTLCGSPLYMAPEILLYHKYDARADLWSVGTILYEMLVGRPPFTGQNHIHLLKNIERREAKIPHSTAQDLSQDCQDLVARLLRRRPTERLTFQDFFAHPFMNEESSELSPLGSRVGGASPQGFGEQPPPFKLTADEWAELQQRGQQGVVDDANQQLSAIIESEYVVVSRPETPGGATRAHASDTGMVLRPPTVSAVSEVDPRAPGGESRAELADAKGVVGSPKSVPGDVATPTARLDAADATDSVLLAGEDAGTHGAGPPPHTHPPLVHSFTMPIRGPPPVTEEQVREHDPFSGLWTAPRRVIVSSSSTDEPPRTAHRVHNMQCMAAALACAAREQLTAQDGDIFKSLSLLLACLSVLECALGLVVKAMTGQEYGANAHPSHEGKEEGDSEPLAAANTEIRIAIGQVVKEAQAVRDRVVAEALNEPESLPDALECAYEASLAWSRGGAVEELSGNTTRSRELYQHAAAVLHFLLHEDSSVPDLPTTFEVSPAYKDKLRHYLSVILPRASDAEEPEGPPGHGSSRRPLPMRAVSDRRMTEHRHSGLSRAESRTSKHHTADGAGLIHTTQHARAGPL